MACSTATNEPSRSPEAIARIEIVAGVTLDADADIERAPLLINDMAETVEKIGLSPFKF